MGKGMCGRHCEERDVGKALGGKEFREGDSGRGFTLLNVFQI